MKEMKEKKKGEGVGKFKGKSALLVDGDFLVESKPSFINNVNH